MRMSEPGAPDMGREQPAPDGRAGLNGQQAWNGAPAGQPDALRAAPPTIPFSALAETQPRLTTPPPHRATAPRGSDMSAGDGQETRKRRRITDSGRIPALRLNRRDRAPHAAEKPRMVYDTQRAPGYLRLARLGAALATLAAAWGVALLVVYLAQALWMVAPHQPVLTERFALYLVDAVGILWLAVVGLALIVVGAFALFLALVRRGW